MKPRGKNAQWGRGVAIVAVSVGIIAVGTAVSNSIGTQPAPTQPLQAATAERPSYLSELPERTQQALQAGLIEPTTVRARAHATLRVASAPAARPASSAVEPAAEPELAAAERNLDAELFRVTANGLNVRSGPSSSSGKLFVLKQNEAVEVAEAEGSWVRIETASGATGWAYQRYLAPPE